MKVLKKLLLTNWHYFSHEVLEFDQINFLTGKNASGKTTIIDALQLLVLGDTAGHFFNKSASDKSSRSLKGYLRCEIGDQDDGNPLYLRNGRFSSYVACEFYDDSLDSSFTLGIVFDTYEDGSYDGKFFSYTGAIPENEFVEGKIPMDQKLLSIYLLNNYTDVNFFQSNTAYREFIKVKLGNLSSTFFSLFKKAIPFTPITNIETFITEYICDVQNNIDVTTMQENFRNYKKLEIETNDLIKRVNVLQDIVEKYDAWKQKQESVSVKQYIMERSNLYLVSNEEEKINIKVQDFRDEIEENKNILEHCEGLLAEAKQKRDRFVEEKFQSDIYKRKAVYKDKQEQLQKSIDELSGKVEHAKNSLTNYIDNWTYGIDILYKDLGEEFKNSKLGQQASSTQKVLRELALEVAGDTVDEQILNKVYKALTEFQAELKRLQFSSLSNNEEISQKIIDAKDEIKSLSTGKKNFDYRLIDFKDAIEKGLFEKYRTIVKVDFLADLLDIKDESWRMAIETYLNTQRFYLIVDPQYVDDAIKIYDRIKRELPYYEYGIVDTEKVLANANQPKANALSQEITSTNKGAQAYVNMLLGSLIKCHRIDDLRKNNRSITKDGMLYQNYVARTLNLSRTTPFIGSGSTKEQLKQKEIQIVDLQNELVRVDHIVKAFGKLTTLEIPNTNEVKTIGQSFADTKELPALVKESNNIQEIIDSMSNNFLNALEKNIADVEDNIKGFEQEKLELNANIVKCNTAIDRLLKEDLPQQKVKLQQLKDDLNHHFVRSWIIEVGEPSFLDILKENSNPQELYNAYKSDIEQIINSLGNQWRYIVELRTRYNTIYELNYDPHDNTNVDYATEYNEFTEVKLKDYQEKIKEAKENALKEFRNDFLAKLKANFDAVISQIDALNDALEHAKFGEDSYRFCVSPRAEYNHYYTMINDPLLLNGQDISAKEFMTKYEDTIEDLFRQITFVDSSLGGDIRAELERNIERFTDYRSYLKFDLIVTNAAGKSQRLSRTLLTKSGGETQTPFYISVLASFAQNYRLYLKSEHNSSIRLIIFDEAFSKMDSERIQESIKLLRSFGLQALVSAPPDKIPDIVPLVDKTLCVVRDNTISTVKDFEKIEKERIAVR